MEPGSRHSHIVLCGPCDCVRPILPDHAGYTAPESIIMLIERKPKVPQTYLDWPAQQESNL